ncbi:MAG: SDR family NAD(P)-dependent oxidoreductase, partial [Hyphomicrobiales bacterium]
ALTDMTRRFLPHLVARGNGGILNISSLAGLTPGPYQATYYATKAYVNSLTFALAHETRKSGIKIGLLLSGPVATEFHSRIGADTAYYIKFLGMKQPDAVAQYATGKFLAGSRAIIPGALNKVSAVLMKLLPRALVVPGVAWLLRLRGEHSI